MTDPRAQLLSSLSLALLLVACAAPGGTSSSSGDPTYPEGYRSWSHVKSMVIREGHPLFDAFGGIHHVYANDPALRGLRAGEGRYADGSAFAFDLLEAPAEGGAITEGGRKVVALMLKDAERYPETGGWAFAAFDPATRANLVGDGGGSCFACHAPQKEQGYVFSSWRD